MPSIEVEGHSDAQFTLVDGKIVRVGASPMAPVFESRLEHRLRD